MLSGFTSKYIGTKYKIEVNIGRAPLTRMEAERALKDLKVDYFIIGPYKTLDKLFRCVHLLNLVGVHA
jgi:hypothetical protein